MVGHSAGRWVRAVFCTVGGFVHHGPSLIRGTGGLRCLPHLSCRDSATFREWVERFSLQDMQWEYDFKVGSQSSETGACEDGVWDYYRGLLCKRIDALCRTTDPWLIVEVKDRGTSLALGQLLCYRDLLAERFPAAQGARLVLVCRSCDPDLSRLLPRYGVEVVALCADARARA